MEPVSLNHGRLRTPILRLQSDERLARLAAGGDEAAFEVLVRRHRPALLRACGRILRAGQAEDAVQQAFLSAHQALLKNGAPERFEPWLHRIGVNAALKELRGSPEDLPLDEAQVDGVEQPPDRLERRERLRSTVAAIGALPDRQRRALVLRELEGRGHEEIARDLGLSQGAVRQLIHRARRSVRSTATALTPYSLLLRLEGTSDGPTRAAEALAGGGAAAFAGKTLAAGVLAGGIASGIAMLPDEGPPANASGGAGSGIAAGSGSGPDDSSSGPGAVDDSSGSDGRDGDDGRDGHNRDRDDEDRKRVEDGSEHGSGSGHGPSGGAPGESGDDDEPDDDDDHGSGSGSSGSGSSGSGSSGSGSSGSGSSGSGSSGSGSSGSSGSGSGEPDEPDEPDDD